MEEVGRILGVQLESGDFNLYGKQGYQKISECTYCRKLGEKKAE